MGLFNQLVKTVARVATLPIAVGVDAIHAFDTTEKNLFIGGSETAATLRALKEDIEDIPASVDED